LRCDETRKNRAVTRFGHHGMLTHGDESSGRVVKTILMDEHHHSDVSSRSEWPRDFHKSAENLAIRSTVWKLLYVG
jgi:hypothetical protein